MDIPQLAAKVVEVLTPYLTAGATAAASEMGKQAVIAFWEKLKPKMEEKESARDALEFLREEPENPSARDSVERQVRKILVDNPSLAAEVGQIIQAGDDNIIVGGNVSGNHINIGKDITITHIYGDKASAPPVSVEQLTQEYLQALTAECERLPLGAIHVTLEKEEREASISLEDVYIDLDVRPRQRGKDAMSLRGKAEAIPDGIQEEREPKRTPILEALADEDLRRVVLLGSWLWQDHLRPLFDDCACRHPSKGDRQKAPARRLGAGALFPHQTGFARCGGGHVARCKKRRRGHPVERPARRPEQQDRRETGGTTLSPFAKAHQNHALPGHAGRAG
jgi:hypothetical protein